MAAEATAGTRRAACRQQKGPDADVTQDIEIGRCEAATCRTSRAEVRAGDDRCVRASRHARSLCAPRRRRRDDGRPPSRGATGVHIRYAALTVHIAHQHTSGSNPGDGWRQARAGLVGLVRINLGLDREQASKTQQGGNPVMDLMEMSQKETLSREDAAARLRALADALAKENEVEFNRGGLRVKVHVPDQVQLKLELEIGDDGSELEFELTW